MVCQDLRGAFVSGPWFSQLPCHPPTWREKKHKGRDGKRSKQITRPLRGFPRPELFPSLPTLRWIAEHWDINEVEMSSSWIYFLHCSHPFLTIAKSLFFSCWTFQLTAPSASQLSIILAQSRYHVPLEKSSRHISNAKLAKCGHKWLQRTGLETFDVQLWSCPKAFITFLPVASAQVHCTKKSAKKVVCWFVHKKKASS